MKKLDMLVASHEPPPPTASRLRKGFLVLRNNLEEDEAMLLVPTAPSNRIIL